MTAADGPPGARPVGGEAGATTEAITEGGRRDGGTPFGALRPRLLRMAWLTLVWILLWGTFTWANLLGGLLVAGFVLAVFPLPGIRHSSRVRPLGLLRVAARVGADLLASSVQVAWQSIRPGPPIRSSIVEVRLAHRSELLMATLVEALSLVPGSVVVEADADRSVLWVHVLGVDDDAGLASFRRRARRLEEDLLGTGVAALEVDRLREHPDDERAPR